MLNVRIVTQGINCHTAHTHSKGTDAAPHHLQCGGKYLSKLLKRMGGMAPCTGPEFARGVDGRGRFAFHDGFSKVPPSGALCH
jgi:hypothetical protein